MTTIQQQLEPPAPASAPLLDVRGLRTEFATAQGLVQAVNEISFTLERGQILGVVGESGSGKSVTARSIMRLLRSPGRVAAGEILFEGQNVLDLPEPEMRRLRGQKIAMVFQDPLSALNPVMSVGAQVAEALTVHGMPKQQAMHRAVELLDQVGIPDARHRAGSFPHEFSGGMRQRVVIAIALANEPSLLIADEPTTALDVTIQAQILRLLAKLVDDVGVSVIMITHDMGIVAELCTDVVVMYGGRIVERGTVTEIFTDPQHPYTADLMRAMPQLDAEPEPRLPAIPGSPPDPANLPTGCSFHVRCRLAEEICVGQRPKLLPIIPNTDHVTACWVTQAGQSIPSVPAQEPAAKPVETATTAHPILQVKDLRVDVTGGGTGRRHQPVFAVDGVSMTLHAGETLGLVGESGCGKSSLARTLVGITPVTQGTISIKGQPITSPADMTTVRETIQYVFQDPYSSLNPRRTVGQSLQEALAQRGVYQDAAVAEARDLIDRVGLLPSHLDRYPAAMSGGQRQRVGIARALAVQPDLIICDEPVSALDVSIQAQIINLLADLRDQLGLAYLFIAHDLAVVRHLSDRVAVMYLGRIVETGPAHEVYGNPQHPYTIALLSSSPEPRVEARSRERIILTGDLPSPKDPPSGCRFRTRCPIGPLFRKDREICETADPQLPTDSAHGAACHFAGELNSVVDAG